MKKVLIIIICLSICLNIPMGTKASENYGASRAEDLVDDNTGMIRELFWSDEFNGSALNEKKWSYIIGDLGPGSRLYYCAREENIIVKNGLLDIVSQIQFDNNHKVKTNSEYSGYISSDRKYDFKYGEIEIKAKMAPGMGVSSSSFLLGKDKPWPRCGEIDLFQYNNSTGLLTQAAITSNINVDENYNQLVWQRTLDTKKFHIFKMRWSDKKIEVFVDNILAGTYDPANYSSEPDPTKDSKAWPFNQPMYINLLGSMVGNVAGERSPYGWTLVKENEGYNDYETHTYVDYVRVYRYKYDPTIIKRHIKSKPASYRAYKKKKSIKLTVELFPNDWINGYEFRIFKTKKNAK